MMVNLPIVNNLVLAIKNFQYEVGVFSKTLSLMVHWYEIHFEFQGRASLHVHLFIWIFNALNIQNETLTLGLLRK